MPLLDRFLGLFSGPAPVDPDEEAKRLRVATAVLLLEVAYADAECTADERRRIAAIVRRRFDLSHTEAEELLEAADCDDSDHMMNGLRALGVDVTRMGSLVRVDSQGLLPSSEPLFLGNSGTAVRFLTAACATISGEVVLDGTPRMRERPIVDLVEALRLWGVTATTETGCPPLRVSGTSRFGGHTRSGGQQIGRAHV